jgi:hypothetical protein
MADYRMGDQQFFSERIVGLAPFVFIGSAGR